jgi:hypothetical protein
MRELQLPDAVRQIHRQVAALLGYPSRGTVRRHPRMLTRRLATSITNSMSRANAARMARSGQAGRGLATFRRACDLVSPHEQLCVLRCLPAGEQCEPAEELTQARVDESDRHGWT